MIDVRNGYVITDKLALHLKAVKSFTDIYGKFRNAGDEWIVDKDTADVHVMDAYE